MTDKKTKESREQARINKQYKDIISIETEGAGNPFYYGNSNPADINSLDMLRKEKEKSITSKVELALKIKKMEESGLFTPGDILQAKRDAGLAPQTTGVPIQQTINSSPTIVMLQNEIAQEDDPDVRISLIQTLAQVQTAMQSTGGAPITIPPINRRKRPEESSTKDKVFDKMLEAMVMKMNKEPEKYDKVADFKSMLTALKDYNEMLSPSEGADDILDNIKKYKDAGFIKNDATSIEEKKLELEKEKITHEYDFKKMQLENEGKRTENLTKIGTDVASSLLESIVDVHGRKGQQPESRAADSQFAKDNLNKASSSVDMFQAPCINCKSNIEVTNVDQPRNIKCPGCGTPYYLDSKNKQLLVVEDAEPAAPPPTAQGNGLQKVTSPTETQKTPPVLPRGTKPN